MAKYIVEIPDEVEISKDSLLVPFDMCRPSWWEEAYNKGKADAKRETGEWIKYVGSFDYDVKCSICDCSNYYETDYCPNCGARMVGEEE